MNIPFRLPLLAGAVALLSLNAGCGKKSADPSAITVSNKDVTATNNSITTIGGATGTPNASAGTGSGAGTSGTSGSSGTTGGAGTTGSGGTSGSTGTNTGTGGSTGSTSSNNGNGGVAIGAVNTIIVRVDGKDYTLSPPNYFLAFGYTTGSAASGSEIGIMAFKLPGGDSFTLTSASGAVGVQDIVTANFYNASDIYGWASGTNASSGKTNITQMNYISETKGTIKGTFDMYLKLESGELKRVVGSYNISM